MLSDNADRETLAEGFREFFEAYSYELTFELDTQEVYILTVLEKSETFAHLKRRVAIVNAERKTSPIGRTARRMVCVCDSTGDIFWIAAEAVAVVSVDGQNIGELSIT